ncbi:uncharacterized protein TM35_000172140 [Trypanosoma theileri]|uniref:Uncharacterized protein n=1 Tax=Trypanosoma theileri TaxID=67003 RepID=A0A1X0NUI7_9TRYP|nr:uncharacterized protein TM35_000172140 [Trypanosoma theileri]ORC88342.1 hypothetical protein TM35_000172140 [Trypanosoma theileri]
MFSSIITSGTTALIVKLCASSSTKVNEIIFRTDLHSFLQAQRESQSEMTPVLNFVERCFPELIVAALHPIPETDSLISPVKKGRSSESTPPDPKVICTNATELVAFYLTFSQDPRTQLVNTVNATISLFESTDIMSSLVSLCFQRLLLVAFEVNPEVAAEAIANMLSEKVIEGVIRNIATSFVVAETIMAVFGSALTAEEMVSPETRTYIFTESWILHNFPQRYASYIETALRSKDHQAYFYFFKEIMKRGFSHSAGPLADIFLKYEVVTELVRTVIESCEEARINPSAIPLVSQGVEVLYSIISLTRKSIIPPDEKGMYAVNIFLNGPVKSFNMYAERFCKLLSCETSVVLPRIDAMRVTVCEVFVEILRFNMKCTDEIITRNLFLEKLILIALKHPNSNRLCLLLKQSILSIFSNDRNIEENIILQHIISRETPPKRGFLSDCVSICASEFLSQTSLSAVLIESCRKLIGKPLFRKSTGPLWHVIESFINNPITRKRMENMDEPITGAGFTALGSGCSDKIQHRPTIDHAGRKNRENSLSIYSPKVNLESAGVRDAGFNGNNRAEQYITEEKGAESKALNNDASDGAAFCKMNEISREGEDTVTVELESGDENLDCEVSAQVRAYPKFGEMKLSFEVRDGGIQENQNECNVDAILHCRDGSVDSLDGEGWAHEAAAAVSQALRTNPDH